MLRITVQERGSEIVLVLEGRLEGPVVPELEQAFAEQRAIAGDLPVVLDLYGLTGMDEAGESSLRNLHQRGADLRCTDVMNGYIVERIERGTTVPLQSPCRPAST